MKEDNLYSICVTPMAQIFVQTAIICVLFSFPHLVSGQPIQTRVDLLSEQLASVDPRKITDELFTSPISDSLWADGELKKEYSEVINSEIFSDTVRFNALFISYLRDRQFYNSIEPGIRAELLCSALEGDFTLWHDRWGWLWAEPKLGYVGVLVVHCGEAAIPHLLKLLSNRDSRDDYYGHEESTDMGMRQYRVKDFAAYFVAQIKDYDLPFSYNLRKRDRSIRKMKRELGL
jgi:hypothetical protein